MDTENRDGGSIHSSNVPDSRNNVEGVVLCTLNLTNWKRRALLSCVTMTAHRFLKKSGHNLNIWTGRAAAIPTLRRLRPPLARWNATASGITVKPTRMAY